MRFEFELAGTSYPVALLRHDDGGRILIGEKAYEASLVKERNGEFTLVLDGVEYPVHVYQHAETAYIHIFGRAWEVALLDPVTQAAAGAQGDVATAPMPGVSVDILVKPGDSVSKGQTLMVIESMKMQTNIIAERDGIVAEVAIAKGQTFDSGALLVRLEPEGK